MSNTLRSLRHAVAGLVAEDRPAFKRIDASSARSDDGSWLRPRPARLNRQAAGSRLRGCVVSTPA